MWQHGALIAFRFNYRCWWHRVTLGITALTGERLLKWRDAISTQKWWFCSCCSLVHVSYNKAQQSFFLVWETYFLIWFNFWSSYNKIRSDTYVKIRFSRKHHYFYKRVYFDADPSIVCALESQSSERMCEFPGKHTYHLNTKTHKIILIVLVHIYALADIVLSCLL